MDETWSDKLEVLGDEILFHPERLELLSTRVEREDIRFPRFSRNQDGGIDQVLDPEISRWCESTFRYVSTSLGPVRIDLSWLMASDADLLFHPNLPPAIFSTGENGILGNLTMTMGTDDGSPAGFVRARFDNGSGREIEGDEGSRLALYEILVDGVDTGFPWQAEGEAAAYPFPFRIIGGATRHFPRDLSLMPRCTAEQTCLCQNLGLEIVYRSNGYPLVFQIGPRYMDGFLLGPDNYLIDLYAIDDGSWVLSVGCYANVGRVEYRPGEYNRSWWLGWQSTDLDFLHRQAREFIPSRVASPVFFSAAEDFGLSLSDDVALFDTPGLCLLPLPEENSG